MVIVLKKQGDSHIPGDKLQWYLIIRVTYAHYEKSEGKTPRNHSLRYEDEL